MEVNEPAKILEDVRARHRRAMLTLRDTRLALQSALDENHALKAELSAAGELIDDLTSEIERLSENDATKSDWLKILIFQRSLLFENLNKD